MKLNWNSKKELEINLDIKGVKNLIKNLHDFINDGNTKTSAIQMFYDLAVETGFYPTVFEDIRCGCTLCDDLHSILDDKEPIVKYNCSYCEKEYRELNKQNFPYIHVSPKGRKVLACTLCAPKLKNNLCIC